jgi:pseudouridine-5'-phosphate glycosidase
MDASSWRPCLHYSDEVQAALVSGGPVVALESTIISHGVLCGET